MAKELFGQVSNLVKRAVKLGINKIDEILTTEENKIKQKKGNSSNTNDESDSNSEASPIKTSTNPNDDFYNEVTSIVNEKGIFEGEEFPKNLNKNYILHKFVSTGYNFRQYTHCQKFIVTKFKDNSVLDEKDIFEEDEFPTFSTDDDFYNYIITIVENDDCFFIEKFPSKFNKDYIVRKLISEDYRVIIDTLFHYFYVESINEN